MTRAVCPGSFDPFTLGHLDVVRRARRLADEVVVLVAHNAAKRPLLDVATRVALIEDAVADVPGVRVAASDGLLADELRSLAGAPAPADRGLAPCAGGPALTARRARSAGIDGEIIAQDRRARRRQKHNRGKKRLHCAHHDYFARRITVPPAELTQKMELAVSARDVASGCPLAMIWAAPPARGTRTTVALLASVR